MVTSRKDSAVAADAAQSVSRPATTLAVGVRDYVHSRVRDYMHTTLNALLLGPPDRLPTSGTGLAARVGRSTIAATTPAVRL